MSDSAREAILGRVRQALRSPSPEPHWAHEPTTTGPIFPLPEPTETALRARFRQEFAAIQGEWLEADSLEAAKTLLADWLMRDEIRSLLAADSPALRLLLAETPSVQWIGGDSTDRRGWEQLDVGVTLAESLVAESGTILVSAGISGRALSVLPPIHLVVATADQLVADLETSMARLRARYPQQLPSTMSWISGPSRTSDIEKTLVLGAHGPRRLLLLMLPAGTLTTTP